MCLYIEPLKLKNSRHCMLWAFPEEGYQVSMPYVLQERVKALSRWVDARPEKIIVLVGHSTYLRELTGMKSRLKNGELHTQHF